MSNQLKNRFSCIVPKCKNTKCKTPGLDYFTLPKNVDRRAEWMHAMRRHDKFSKSICCYVCADHFDVSIYIII
jgi:hypothetical protein